jgi:hypothetical protein
VNNYPFWEGVPVECALKSFHQSYLSLLSVANGKTIFISESGWKTEGPPVGEAVPSIVNSARYLRELLNWSKATGIEVGIFSAFDEPWKITKNDYGWGVFTPEGSLKIGLEEIFDPIVNIETTWLCNKINIATTDTLNIDYLPPIGNTDELLSGRVNFINSCDVRISAYIKVSNGWWTKPTFTEPSVPVLCNGRFNLRFVTGGMDYSATDIYIFLIPADYTPPTCGGCTTLPLEVFANAIARKLITRCPLPFDDITANPSSVCEGSTSTLSVSGGVSYLWNSGEATPAITVHPKLTTSYSVMVTRASGCIETRSTQILFKAKPFIWLGEDRTTDTYGNVILDAGAYNPAPSSLTYLWSTGATTRQINVHYDNPGNYPFRAEITDVHGCINLDTVLVTVLLATGVRENNSKGNILCYPNPVRNGTISFRSDGQPLPEKSTLLIIDNQGRTVKRVNNIQLDQSVDIKELPSGIYNVSIYKGKPGEGFTGKISVLK